ncbi:MAG: hypothetical protein ACTSU4_13980 [Promethearchaeota archaeon]
MAEMLMDLLQNIYNRISQLGMSIQSLKQSLDELNKNIERQITNLTEKMSDFSKEIEITQTKHVSTMKDIGEEVTRELKVLEQDIGLEAFKDIMAKLETFSQIAEEVLNQENVNLLLSEAINSVKEMRENLNKGEEITKTGEKG